EKGERINLCASCRLLESLNMKLQTVELTPQDIDCAASTASS
ncbi:MAG: hypothetical protein RLZZ535_598, partial [Cyanobacteriota bacterium]